MNILFVCLLTIGHVLGESNYCSITRDHTMCRYRGVGHTCKNPKERGLSKLEKKEVLDYHNRFVSSKKLLKIKLNSYSSETYMADMTCFSTI